MIRAAVVDASVAVKWVVEEPNSDRARLLSEVRLEAPDLLPVECANILWKKVRLRDLAKADAHVRLQLLRHAPVSLADSRSLLDTALGISLELDHPVYDCIYLALAFAHKIPLITADGRLVAVARKLRKLAACVMSLADLE